MSTIYFRSYLAEIAHLLLYGENPTETPVEHVLIGDYSSIHNEHEYLIYKVEEYGFNNIFRDRQEIEKYRGMLFEEYSGDISVQTTKLKLRMKVSIDDLKKMSKLQNI